MLQLIPPIAHFLRRSNQTLHVIALVSISLILSACSSLGGGSVEKRAAKLAQGIQSAYAVPSSTANRIAPLLVENAQRYDLDPLLLAAVVRQESSYRSQVTSPAGAVGLMQVMPRYWQANCGQDLFNEAVNVQCGAFILAKYQTSAGNMKKALGYYNVGPSAFKNNRKMRKQGKKYAKQVKQHQKKLKTTL